MDIINTILGFVKRYDVYIITVLTTLLWLPIFESSMHMFQLNSYKSGRHFKWLSRNLHKVYFKSKTKAKKPLVYTHRVIRMYIPAFIIYLLCGMSLVWTGNFLYLPAIAVLAPIFPIIANTINMPLENINNNRYIKDAKRIIDSRPDLITIGITGSYGKTSTKYYLHKLLSAKFNTLMTPESFNTTLGVVKTIRNELQPTHEVFVCEMGMMWKGDIAELCDIAKPKHAMLTSIGAQHLETMKTQENIIKEKFSITDTITDGICFLNYDNEFIKNHVKEHKLDKNIIRYGIYEQTSTNSDGLDYVAKNISVSENGTSFTISAGEEQQTFETTLIGSHNVQNIVGAIAVAHKLGVKLSELILPVKRLETAPHRLEIKKNGNTVIIDDSFNSNPIGAKAALDTLRLFEGTRVLITPGMVELGDKLFELNKELGKQAADSCDYALLIGEKQAVPIKEGLLEAGFTQDKIHVFNSFNDGMTFANGLKEEKKIILIENDLPDNY